MLTEPERALFRRLAVFMGGFGLDAAQAVAVGSEVERYQVFDQLAPLFDKSLVVAESCSAQLATGCWSRCGSMRWRSSGSPGANTVRSRHRDYYLALAAELDAAARTGHQHRVEHAEVEIDNLRAALGWCRENVDVAMALQLAASLQPLWLAQGRVREGLS